MEINNRFTKATKGSKIVKIMALIVTAIFNIILIATLILAKNYYNLALNASIFLIISLILILFIIDLIIYLGFRYDDFKLNIIGGSISLAFGIILSIACIYLTTINSSINKMIDNTGTEQYETISVTLACYKDDYKELKDCVGKKVGILSEAEVGTASIFKDKMEKESLKVNYEEYNTTSDLFLALITDEIDVGVFPSNYRMLYKDDEESDFSAYLDNVTDFYSFEEKVKTGDNALANADLTLEPFNVLLIGFAPEEGSNGKYGLADSIIVATVNPQTLEVGLTSIARDSYVPISCYSGYKDKINAARGKSRQCLMDTVGELLDLDIDLYMEANFQAVVEIVDAVDGIDINSPVAFVGQTSSEVRGTYTIQIPQGYFHANGEEALAYARERHAMPAGDFDRQEHQKEVIARVVEKILETRDINTITNIIKACGDNLSTNISVKQITQFFNHVISLKNYTTLDLSMLVDMQNARLTGYSSWYYNYSAHLPLWIYKLYNGSIEEAKAHIDDVINGYRYTYKENDCAKFFSYYAYERPKWYHTVFNEVQEDEQMPAFYKTLTNMSYSEVMEWASVNGVSVNVEMILPGDSRYDESRNGQVLSQSVPYGSLVSDYPSVTIVVMGEALSEENRIPNFVGKSINQAITWCRNNGITYTAIEVANTDNSKSELVITQSVSAGSDKRKVSSIEFTYYQKVVKQITAESLATLIGKSKADVEAFCSSSGISNYSFAVDQGASGTCGKITSVSPSSGTSDSTFVFYQAPHSFVEDSSLAVNPTCGTAGKKVFKCSVCGETKEEEVPATGQHSFGEWSLYDESGTKTHECNVCHKVETETMTCPNGFDVGGQTCIIPPEEDPNNPTIPPEES